MTIVLETVAWFADAANWLGPTGILVRLAEHIALSGLAILLAIAVALPAGLAIGHSGRGERLATAVAGLGRAVPSYALLILFVPLVGLDALSAVPALVLLAIPPILVNTVAGFRGLDPDVIDAGRGVGMTARELLTRVEVPLALPAILAGIRTAAVQVVATATLAALVAGGGLGRFITAGFGLRQYDRLLAGAILVALLALATELAFALLERRAEARIRAGGGSSVADLAAVRAEGLPFA